MARSSWIVAIALVQLAACESKVTTTIDVALQQRVVTLKDCFPALYPRLEALLTIAQCWRLGNATPTADPPGAFATVGVEPGGTVVTVQYPASGTVVTMRIRCFSPTGVQQTIALDGSDGSSSIGELVRAAAEHLRTQFPGDALPFVVGDFTIAGGGVEASDEALLGLVDGTASAPRLAVVRTCAPRSTIAGGPPATDPCTIIDLGPPVCAIRFVTAELLLDETPTQQYPIGTVSFSLDGPLANVTGTITFDGTSTLGVAVDGVRGRFTFDTAKRELAYVP